MENQNFNRTVPKLLKADSELKNALKILEDKTPNMAILFIDICDSTSLKKKPQKKWLPLILTILSKISQIVEKHHGEVIKYIGDEVFATFKEDENMMASWNVESCIYECSKELEKSGVSVKYSIDYGKATSIEFIKGAPDDVLGECVDRCSRISKLLDKNTALASEYFVNKSQNKSNWEQLGIFPFRGIAKPISVYQYQNFGNKIQIIDPMLYTLKQKDLIHKLNNLKNKLLECNREIHRLRKKQ